MATRDRGRGPQRKRGGWSEGGGGGGEEGEGEGIFPPNNFKKNPQNPQMPNFLILEKVLLLGKRGAQTTFPFPQTLWGFSLRPGNWEGEGVWSAVEH